MNAHKPKGETVADELQAMDAERAALIAFYRAESPWMAQKCENLKRGDPLTMDDRRTLDGIQAAARALAA